MRAHHKDQGYPDSITKLSLGIIELAQEWIRTKLNSLTSPKNLHCITGYGDAMKDTYSDGDILFVDTGIHDVKIDTVYVYSMDDELSG